MDPNKVLEELRALKAEYGWFTDRFKSAKLFDALDEWLSNDELLPDDWERSQ